MNINVFDVCIISYRESLCTIPASANRGTYNIKIESEMHWSSEAKKKHCQLTQLIDHYGKCHNMLFNVCHPIILHHFAWIFCILYGILGIVFGSLGWLVSLESDKFWMILFFRYLDP